METFIRNSGAINVGPIERMASVAAGGVLLARGLRHKSTTGAVLALAGADLLYRGTTGRSYLYQLLGVSSVPRKNERTPLIYRQGIRIDHAITINKPAAELYQFWRQFENLPTFMDHVLAVRLTDANRSHWIARGPGGSRVEWDAEITADVPNQMIGWRSLPGSEIATAGSVYFRPAPGGRGTEVKVEMQYLPPGGILTALFAKLFGEEPDQQIREDLRHFKQIMETGEIPTTEGQPMGPSMVESSRAWQARERQAKEERARISRTEEAA